MRYNSEAILRDDLGWMLKRPDLVLKRRRAGICFLCCSTEINEAALCGNCMALLSDEEINQVERWMRGDLG